MNESGRTQRATRVKIVTAAAGLLQEHGPAAVTTRAVAQHAGVQAPAIYRLFGDKDGLLESVAEHVMASYVSAKAATMEAAAADDVDPLADLCAGWRTQVAFGVANPALFRLLSDPDRVVRSPAARAGRQVLQSRVHRMAMTGQLRVSEQRAAALIQAAGTGTIQALLSVPPQDRDPGLADAMLDAVLQHILISAADRPHDEAQTVAITLRALAPQLGALSAAEKRLMIEWLDRVIAHGAAQRTAPV